MRWMILLIFLTILSGCASTAAPVVTHNPVRIPANLLTPIPHPVILDYPVTVNILLITISQYEALLDKANDRFEEIYFIQDIISLEENK